MKKLLFALFLVLYADAIPVNLSKRWVQYAVQGGIVAANTALDVTNSVMNHKFEGQMREKTDELDRRKHDFTLDVNRNQMGLLDNQENYMRESNGQTMQMNQLGFEEKRITKDGNHHIGLRQYDYARAADEVQHRNDLGIRENQVDVAELQRRAEQIKKAYQSMGQASAVSMATDSGL